MSDPDRAVARRSIGIFETPRRPLPENDRYSGRRMISASPNISRTSTTPFRSVPCKANSYMSPKTPSTSQNAAVKSRFEMKEDKFPVAKAAEKKTMFSRKQIFGDSFNMSNGKDSDALRLNTSVTMDSIIEEPDDLDQENVEPEATGPIFNQKFLTKISENLMHLRPKKVVDFNCTLESINEDESEEEGVLGDSGSAEADITGPIFLEKSPKREKVTSKCSMVFRKTPRLNLNCTLDSIKENESVEEVMSSESEQSVKENKAKKLTKTKSKEGKWGKKEEQARDSEKLAMEELTVFKANLAASLIDYCERKAMERGENTYQVLDEKYAKKFLEVRYRYYTTVNEDTMSMFFKLLKGNFHETISQDVYSLLLKRQHLKSKKEFVVMEKLYYQMIAKKVHPDLAANNQMILKSCGAEEKQKMETSDGEVDTKEDIESALFTFIEEILEPEPIILE